MNDLQIEYFLAVADSLSFTKTAADKYVSQPAISRQIQTMEKELGVTLFKRGQGSIRLTDAGKLFVGFFQAQREQLKELSRQTYETAREKRLALKLAIDSCWTLSDFLPDILRRVRETPEYEDLNISIICHDFQKLETLVLGEDADIAFALNENVHTIPSLEAKLLLEIDRFIIFAKGHPAAAKEIVDPADFSEELFFIPKPNDSAYIANLLRSFMEPYGFIPNLQYVNNSESIFANVANGLGVAVVDEWSVNEFKNAVESLRIGSKYKVMALWKKKNSNPALKVFLSELFKDH
jgi:DNA-binding transcriptional LysR family regulator